MQIQDVLRALEIFSMPFPGGSGIVFWTSEEIKVYYVYHVRIFQGIKIAN